MKDVSMKELKNKATEMRMKVVDMIYKAQSGHPGGSLSAADFMTVWFFPKDMYARFSMHASEHSDFSRKKNLIH